MSLLILWLISLCQNLIDLAGSESSKTETTGLRRKEGSYINKSLLTLGTVSVQLIYYFMEFVLEWKATHTLVELFSGGKDQN